MVLASALAGRGAWRRAEVLQERLERGGQVEYVYQQETPFRSLSSTSAAPLFRAGAAVRSAAEVPSPRVRGSWVTDMAGLLDQKAVRHIDALADSVRRRTGGEVAVVTVPRVEGGKPAVKPFATRLFNRWGIGDRYKNNGVLVIVSVGDRRVEVEIGRGLNTALNRDGWLRGMVDSELLPALRQGRWDKGVLNAVSALSSKLVEVNGEVSSPARYRQTATLFYTASVGLMAAVAVVLLGLPGRTPRCSLCGQRMARLRDARDAELSPGALAELRVGSASHVLCGCRRPSCRKLWAEQKASNIGAARGTASGGRRLAGGAILSREVRLTPDEVGELALFCKGLGISKEARFGSPYRACSACGFRTALATTSTVTPPTTVRSGKVAEVTDCFFCNHRSVKFTYLPPTSSSSSDSSSSSSSDFGGGTSSGGGAGGDF